jgi:hypothetical protein
MVKAPRGLLLLAPLALAACGGSGALGTKPDTLRYAMRNVAKSDGECRSADSLRTPAPCVSFDVSWPEVTDSTPAALAARQFIDRLAAASFHDGADRGSADSAAAEGIAAHADMRTKHAGYDVPWLMHREITVACNRPGTFAVRVHTNQFTGGTHGSEATRFWSFDTRTGKRLGLADLVAKGQERAFKESMVAVVEKRERRPETPQLKLDVDSFPMPASLLACGDSLFVQYDVLKFGPHQKANEIVAVKRDSIKGLATP